MALEVSFVLSNILLGTGLAMDAFSVSLANGLNEPQMSRRKAGGIAALFAACQFIMPMLGWLCISSLARTFQVLQGYIPWIAFLLLAFLGGKMIYEGLHKQESQTVKPCVGIAALLAQGVATSIDALSVGFTICHYEFPPALIACSIIGLVTFIICTIGVELGKKAGTKMAGKADILGGAILILIGLRMVLPLF